MKVFVAKTGEKWYSSPTLYNWCDEGEILTFGQFQLDNSNPSNVSMCGIKTRKFTTEITVKDMDISKEFYKELLSESIEKAFECSIDKKGFFTIKILIDHKFNVNDIVEELLCGAIMFKEGIKIVCRGRWLYPD